MGTLPFHPLAELFPLMEGQEFADLVADVRANGLREPITTLDDRVLDGRNRLRACAAAGVAPRYEAFNGTDPVAFVISLNLRRRHLNESQRAMVAAKLANLRQGERTDLPPIGGRSQGISQPRAAELLNVSERSVERAAAVQKAAVPELIHKVESGKVAVSAAAEVAHLPPKEQTAVVAEGEAEIIARANAIKRQRKQERRAERQTRIDEAAAAVPAIAERYELHAQPCAAAMLLPERSIDLIVTDPPYEAEFLGAYNDLAQVASHLLKPGALALVMTGQTHLPDVIAALGKHLSYHWTVAYLTPGGQAVQQFQRRVNAFWKPVLVYSHGEYVGEWFGDVAKSEPNDNDKEHHRWGQSASGMRDLMRRFVRPGMKVLDPFLGGGTTAVVALELGATFVGFDTDPHAIVATKARIGEMHAALVA